MRLIVLAVGRLKAGPERELWERYAKRLSGVAPPLGLSVDWREFDEGRAKSVDERRSEEARTLLAAAPKGAWIVALDERGTAPTSPQWAAEIGKARDSSVPAYVMIIGGPDGLAGRCRTVATSPWSSSNLSVR